MLKFTNDSKAALRPALKEAANHHYLAGRLPSGSPSSCSHEEGDLSAVIPEALAEGLGQQTADGAVAVIAAEIMALIPDSLTPPRRSHQLVESRQQRLVGWRFDAMIAARALVRRMPLLHDDAVDWELIRSAIERFPMRFPGLGLLELMRCAVTS